MRKTLTITIDVNCPEAEPDQKERLLEGIAHVIKEAAKNERCDPGNKIISIGWDESRAVYLDISIQEGPCED